jgi:hypothetical protein
LIGQRPRVQQQQRWVERGHPPFVGEEHHTFDGKFDIWYRTRGQALYIARDWPTLLNMPNRWIGRLLYITSEEFHNTRPAYPFPY